MIGQNRQAAFQQAKADHDFNEAELELRTSTELTRQIHALTSELHRRVTDERAGNGSSQFLGSAPRDTIRRPRLSTRPADGVQDLRTRRRRR
ncbi:hypothetical protein [Pseudonocardia sp.]|uniref:hypothetical protein n=1 Tax=Pseudonocardia sp. TaxID=60912 RepID=UPI0026299CFC|nr:hypothetical protein [Pseudonocardia sp.]